MIQKSALPGLELTRCLCLINNLILQAFVSFLDDHFQAYLARRVMSFSKIKVFRDKIYL